MREYVDALRALWTGKPVTYDGTLHKLRGAKMAMIFQDPMSSLHPFYRVGAQLAEAAQVHRKLSKKAARAEAIERRGPAARSSRRTLLACQLEHAAA